jgi:hypothetical protein
LPILIHRHDIARVPIVPEVSMVPKIQTHSNRSGGSPMRNRSRVQEPALSMPKASSLQLDQGKPCYDSKVQRQINLAPEFHVFGIPKTQLEYPGAIATLRLSTNVLSYEIKMKTMRAYLCLLLAGVNWPAPVSQRAWTLTQGEDRFSPAPTKPPWLVFKAPRRNIPTTFTRRCFAL